MNADDRDLFAALECAFSTFWDKNEHSGEIPWQAESLMGKIQTYEGDLPQSGAYKPDKMPSVVDKFRKFHVTDEEHFAAKVFMLVPLSLRYFIIVEPLIRRREKVTQKVIAAVLGCSVSQYEKKRARAKIFAVAIARKLAERKRKAA